MSRVFYGLIFKNMIIKQSKSKFELQTGRGIHEGKTLDAKKALKELRTKHNV